MLYGIVGFKKGRLSLADLKKVSEPLKGTGLFLKKESKHGKDLMQGIFFIAGFKDLRGLCDKECRWSLGASSVTGKQRPQTYICNST